MSTKQPMELNAVEDGSAVEDVAVEVVVGDEVTVDVVDEVVVAFPPPELKPVQVSPKSPEFLKVSAAPPPTETSNLVFRV